MAMDESGKLFFMATVPWLCERSLHAVLIPVRQSVPSKPEKFEKEKTLPLFKAGENSTMNIPSNSVLVVSESKKIKMSREAAHDHLDSEKQQEPIL